ncbi:MAG: DUF167 domain-containing protein [Armatimonadetes bacterium]|nr:DUF167 domain-containing protein [Armatimonadota bacterium]MDE2206383.1 DUF167 domain-containing protein [Armatimonadota bacterium]
MEGRGPIDETAVIRVRLTPKADRDAVSGIIDGEVQVRVRAAPSDGAANEALIRVLAKAAGVAASAARIVSGRTSRRKLVQITGAPAQAVIDRLEMVATRPGSATRRCDKAKD